jgi:hypothetical protein
MDYSLMTAKYFFLAAALLFLNASSFNSEAYQQLPVQTVPDQLERVGLPDWAQGDAAPPWWSRGLDEKTLAEAHQMTAALQKYMSDKNITTPLPKTLTLDDLVKAKYLKEIPPAPAGKKFAIARTYAIVVVIDNK